MRRRPRSNSARNADQMDAYIALRGSDNIFEAAGRAGRARATGQPVDETGAGPSGGARPSGWCCAGPRPPCGATSDHEHRDKFEDFYFRVCTLDYARMKPGMKALGRSDAPAPTSAPQGSGYRPAFLHQKGIGAQECGGLRNIPDGEVFSCPVKDSVEGVVQ